MIAFVLGLAFLLLLVAFRSLVVPLKAIVLNLLSVGASYGVLVLVFQHHWAEGLLGFKSNRAIISWLPLFLFVVIFRLSMEHHVFILSRVREAVDAGMRTEEAVRYGITVTAGVVTSAALVMIGVFSLFGSLSGWRSRRRASASPRRCRSTRRSSGRAAAGDDEAARRWNWYLPQRLEWVPSAELEAPPVREPA